MTETDPAATLRAKLDAAKAAVFGEIVHTRTELMIAVLRDLRAVLDELDVLRQMPKDGIER